MFKFCLLKAFNSFVPTSKDCVVLIVEQREQGGRGVGANRMSTTRCCCFAPSLATFVHYK